MTPILSRGSLTPCFKLNKPSGTRTFPAYSQTPRFLHYLSSTEVMLNVSVFLGPLSPLNGNGSLSYPTWLFSPALYALCFDFPLPHNTSSWRFSIMYNCDHHGRKKSIFFRNVNIHRKSIIILGFVSFLCLGLRKVIHLQSDQPSLSDLGLDPEYTNILTWI